MGPLLAQAEHGELSRFLTARYRLFTVIAGRLAAAAAEHRPWLLRGAEVLRLDPGPAAARRIAGARR